MRKLEQLIHYDSCINSSSIRITKPLKNSVNNFDGSLTETF